MHRYCFFFLKHVMSLSFILPSSGALFFFEVYSNRLIAVSESGQTAFIDL